MGIDIIIGAAGTLLGVIGITCALWIGRQGGKWKQAAHVSEHNVKRLEHHIAVMNDTFLELRGQRHDMMKHVGAIQYLLESGRIDEANRYVEQLIGLYDHVHASMKGEDGHLASLLLHIRRQGEDEGIIVDYGLDAPLTIMPLSPIDQTRLMGNLLHNALEAAREAVRQGLEGRIKLYTASIGGHFILELSNTSPRIPAHVLDKMFAQSGQTTKKGAHEGLGTYIIGKLVHTHHGSLDYSWDTPLFTVKIKLPFIEKK